MDYQLDKNTPKDLTASDCSTMREQGIFYFEGVKLEIKNNNHSSFDVLAKGGRTQSGQCVGDSFIYHSSLFFQNVIFHRMFSYFAKY